jgi:hypothetical protein
MTMTIMIRSIIMYQQLLIGVNVSKEIQDTAEQRRFSPLAVTRNNPGGPASLSWTYLYTISVVRQRTKVTGVY